MSKLVFFKDQDGRPAWVNPDHILTIEQTKEGSTKMYLIHENYLFVKATVVKAGEAINDVTIKIDPNNLMTL